MQGAPFGLISNFGKEQLRVSSDFPGLQRFIASELLLIKVPDNLACSIPTHPLPVNIDVDIDVESTRDMHCHIGSRDRLTKGRSWSDGRKKRDDDLERLSRLVTARSGDAVC